MDICGKVYNFRVEKAFQEIGKINKNASQNEDPNTLNNDAQNCNSNGFGAHKESDSKTPEMQAIESYLSEKNKALSKHVLSASDEQMDFPDTAGPQSLFRHAMSKRIEGTGYQGLMLKAVTQKRMPDFGAFSLDSLSPGQQLKIDLSFRPFINHFLEGDFQTDDQSVLTVSHMCRPNVNEDCQFDFMTAIEKRMASTPQAVVEMTPRIRDPATELINIDAEELDFEELSNNKLQMIGARSPKLEEEAYRVEPQECMYNSPQREQEETPLPQKSNLGFSTPESRPQTLNSQTYRSAINRVENKSNLSKSLIKRAKEFWDHYNYVESRNIRRQPVNTFAKKSPLTIPKKERFSSKSKERREIFEKYLFSGEDEPLPTKYEHYSLFHHPEEQIYGPENWGLRKNFMKYIIGTNVIRTKSMFSVE